jgi:hypothetical protein
MADGGTQQFPLTVEEFAGDERFHSIVWKKLSDDEWKFKFSTTNDYGSKVDVQLTMSRPNQGPLVGDVIVTDGKIDNNPLNIRELFVYVALLAQQNIAKLPPKTLLSALERNDMKALMDLSSKSSKDELNKALGKAISQTNSEAVKILVKSGADVNSAQGTFEPALVYFTEKNDIAVVKDLLVFRPNQESLDKSILIACEKGNIDLVDILLKSGASLKAEGYKGATPLSVAIDKGHDDLSIYLINNKVDLYNLVDFHSKTNALQLSLTKKRYKVSLYLINFLDGKADKELLGKALVYSQEHKLTEIETALKVKGVTGKDDEGLVDFPGVYYLSPKTNGFATIKKYSDKEYHMSINTNNYGEKCDMDDIIFSLKYDTFRTEFTGVYVEDGHTFKIKYRFSDAIKTWSLTLDYDNYFNQKYCAQQRKKGGSLGVSFKKDMSESLVK